MTFIKSIFFICTAAFTLSVASAEDILPETRTFFWCYNNYVCPANSYRIPHRWCYDDFDDCACNYGYYKSHWEHKCIPYQTTPPCKNDFVCPMNSYRLPYRACYDTFDDCECNHGFYKPPSGEVKCLPFTAAPVHPPAPTAPPCKNDFVCPANSYRLPNQQCYDTFYDCECNHGFYKSPSGEVKCLPITKAPTTVPVKPPTKSPTKAPTKSPITKAPTKVPTRAPVKPPTKAPTKAPVKPPTKAPTKLPTRAPRTMRPTRAPRTMAPTKTPRTMAPTKGPTRTPTKAPTKAPVKPLTKAPVKSPMKVAAPVPVKVPTKAPVKPPTKSPTKVPVMVPVSAPAKVPTMTAPVSAPIQCNFKCPSNSYPIPNRGCYDNFDDCQCFFGYIKSSDVCIKTEEPCP